MLNYVFNRFKKSGPDRYVTIKTYNSPDSESITNALDSSTSKVYFYDDGNIEVDSSGTKTRYANPLNTKSFDSNTTETNKIIYSSNSKYAFSRPFGKYILYIESPSKVQLKYNPIPRPEFVKQLNSQNASTFNDYVFEHCFDTNKLDPICSCMQRDNNLHPNDPRDTEFCMADLIGSSKLDIKRLDARAYNEIANICDCSNTKCMSEHPYRKAFRDLVGECPKAMQVTICNATFDAVGGIKAGDVNIAQKCGSSMAQNTIPPSTTTTPPQNENTPSSPSSTTTTPPQNENTPSSPSSTATTPQNVSAPSTPSSPVEESTTTKILNWIKQNWIISAIVVLILLFGLYKMTQQNQPSYYPQIAYPGQYMQMPASQMPSRIRKRSK